MDIWADKLHDILEQNQVVVYLLAKYVDDINLATSLIKEEATWIKKGNKWILSQEEPHDQEQESLQTGNSPQETTMKKIMWLGDRLVPGIKLTMDQMADALCLISRCGQKGKKGSQWS